MFTRTLRALLLGVGIVVLAVLIVRTGPATIGAMVRSVGWGFLLVSALYATHLAARALALWRSMPDGALPYREVLSVRLAGEAVEMLTLTGPFLAEPAKGYLLQCRGLTGANAYGAVALEYLLYTLVSAWMAGAALSMLLARDLLPHGMRGAVIGVIAAMIVFTLGCVWAAASGIGLVAPIVRLLARPLGRDRTSVAVSRIEAVERVLVGFMHHRTSRLLEVISIEAGGHALLAAEVWVVLSALGLHLAPADPVLFEGGVKFISVAFFFVPGQVGASEGVYALLARALAFPAAAGLTLALVRRVRGLIVAATGLGVLTLVTRWRPPSSSLPAQTPRR